MAWTTVEKLGAGVAGAVVVGAVWFGSMGSAEAATSPEQPQPPVERPTPPTGTDELQPDPFPTESQLTSMSSAGKKAIMRTVQFQLNALGYGPLQVDGVAGPATGAALNRFVSDDQTMQPVTGGAAAAEVAAAVALDAMYRSRFNLPDRLPSSGSIYGRAARRSARVRGYAGT